MHQNRFRPPDPLVGWGGGYPIPYPPRRLDPRAFGARLGACGASTPCSSRLRRSAASQRLKPTLLLPSGAATDFSTYNKHLGPLGPWSAQQSSGPTKDRARWTWFHCNLNTVFKHHCYWLMYAVIYLLSSSVCLSYPSSWS